MSETTTPAFDNTPLTVEQVRDTCERQANGVWLAALGEDGEAGWIALGHVTAHEMCTAIALDTETTADHWLDGTIARGWGVATPHATDCDGTTPEADWDDPKVPEPCTCNDLDYGFVWFIGEVLSDVAEANAKRPGAIAVTRYSE